MIRPKVQFITIDSDHSGRRIDNYLLNYLKGVPKSLLYRLIRKGEIRVNKKRIKPDYKLKNDDEIRVAPIAMSNEEKIAKPGQALRQLLDRSVLYEDEQLLAINKPSGLAVHGGSGVNCGLIEALREMRPHARYLELVHRLDRDTSGCILIAKKPQILREMHQLLREDKIKKQYLALTLGHWPKQQNRVSINLRKNVMSSGERKMKADEEGKIALTDFRVKQRFSHCELVEITLHTGRMHQIRVHAQLSGHSVGGDSKYGDRAFNRLMKQSFDLKRLFLHAEQLTFILPSSTRKITICAEIEPSLQKVLTRLSDKN